MISLILNFSICLSILSSCKNLFCLSDCSFLTIACSCLKNLFSSLFLSFSNFFSSLNSFSLSFKIKFSWTSFSSSASLFSLSCLSNSSTFILCFSSDLNFLNSWILFSIFWKNPCIALSILKKSILILIFGFSFSWNLIILSAKLTFFYFYKYFFYEI